MWALKVLSGPLAGRVFILKPGKNRLGRSDSCDIVLVIPGVSKQHAEVEVLSDKVLIQDLNSSNGTLLNGVRIQGGLLRVGDKLGLGNSFVALVQVEKVPAMAPGSAAATPRSRVPREAQQIPVDLGSAMPPSHPNPIQSLQDKFQDKLENALLPGFYKLGESFELRWILLGLVLSYIILVTLASMIPLRQITAESIQSESRRRALTIARALAQSNERVLKAGDFSAFSTDIVLREEGIDDVYVVSREGNILAPSDRVGSSVREVSFIRSIRGQTREVTSMISDRVGAAVPILGYDPELQQNVARAYAVVIYNPGGLKFDEGRAFALFVQMLFFALLLGALLYFFMWNLIQFPLRSLVAQLNGAIQERKDHIEIRFQDTQLQSLLTIVNSLLVRVLAAGNSNSPQSFVSRENEMIQLASLFAYPTIILNHQRRIIRANTSFENLLSLSPGQLDVQELVHIPDQALQKNIASLLESAMSQPETLAQDRLEMSGHFFRIQCQALRSSSGEIEFFVVNISPEESSQGSAA